METGLMGDYFRDTFSIILPEDGFETPEFRLIIRGGEGEGEPICGALWRDGAPISGGVGDLALLTLVVGAMLFHRQRKPGSMRS
jgi:hypothetical protein